MAWTFARYVGRAAEAGKAEYPLPMFVNAWAPGFSKDNQHANGQSGSPMPDTLDVWRAGAPQIDMIYARHLRLRLRDDVRAVHPVREPAVHTRDAGIAAERDGSPGALRLRTP